MKICIAQISSKKEKVLENIQSHIRLVRRAIKYDADLIIFPELSITGYEPKLAQKYALDEENEFFIEFQELANKSNIYIGVGMPTIAVNGIKISTLIFQPNKERIVYSKQLLHEDEIPYFVNGNKQSILTIKDKKVALGICYETLQKEHFLRAYNEGIDIYIASVAKSSEAVDKAHKHYSSLASEFNKPILMSNCVGYCDDFMSIGKSAVWNQKGEVITQLDSSNEGLLLYDYKTNQTEKEQLKIENGVLSDIDNIFKIYKNAKIVLDNRKIFQWTNNYPSLNIIENDLKKDCLFVLKNADKIIGSICINEEHELEYEKINWKFNTSRILVIHRLVIEPNHQSRGYATILMNFAENYAKEKSYNSIRLDAYSRNHQVIEFYKKRKYIVRGEIFFKEREHPFYAMEKEIIK